MIKVQKQLNLEDNLNIIDNVIQVSQYTTNQSFIKQVLNCFNQYFSERCNYTLGFYGDNNQLEGILLANIDFHPDINNTAFDLKPDHVNDIQYLELRKRIKNGYKAMNVKPKAEIEFFSALTKGKGVGSQLLKHFEDHIKSLGINEYFLFTNQICHFNWYTNHNFKLVNSSTIDISDLDALFKGESEFKLMCFSKSLD